MSLQNLLQYEFPPISIENGESLATRATVSVPAGAVDPTAQQVTSTMALLPAITTQLLKPGHWHMEMNDAAGTQTEIAANGEDKMVHLHCTCNDFQSGVPCKHLWAAIRTIEAMTPYDGITEDWLCDFQFSAIDFAETHAKAEPSNSEPWSTALNNLLHPNADAPKATTAAAQPIVARSRLNTRGKGPALTPHRRGAYAVDLRSSQERNRIVMRFYRQDLHPSGKLFPPTSTSVSHSQITHYPDEIDKNILWSLLGKTNVESDLNSIQQVSTHSYAVLTPEYSEELLQTISDAGRLRLLDNRFSSTKTTTGDLQTYELRPEDWYLQIHLRKIEDAYYLQAALSNGTEKRRFNEIICTAGHLVLFKDFIVRTDAVEHSAWFEFFQKRRDVEIPSADLAQFLEDYFRSARAPTLLLPEDINFTELPALEPHVRMTFLPVEKSALLQCQLEFAYGELKSTLDNHSQFIFDLGERKKQIRDVAFERKTQQEFLKLHPILPRNTRFKNLTADGLFDHDSFLSAVDFGLSQGWEVVAYQKQIRQHKDFRLQITSGVDWFDLSGKFEFEGGVISLPQLVQNIRSGERLVKLGDGSYGVLPEQWLQRIRPIIDMALKPDKTLRLNKVQALFLTAALPENEKLDADKKFHSLKQVLADLAQLKPLTPNDSFQGELRPYQKEGLGWLQMVSHNLLGGILADDMGLGKTIQVLALLSDAKRAGTGKPHLVVAPKSLIFNWIQEAKRFTPNLTVLDFTGPKRHALHGDLDKHDLILTTYQTLRSDVERIRAKNFDYFILDEAHFIKNPDSQAALACRMVQAEKKLALSGTPVENSLSDLFSILSVVTPGLLNDTQLNRWSKETNPEAITTLAKSLRPFILRRTKEQVLQDLPEKSEQILYCELSTEERKKYNELRSYYWNNLSQKIETNGLARAKIEVLEALLRLRQASCHQGLLDEKLRGSSSAKFELLLSQMQSIIKDGHKILVFSQFTSLLELLKRELTKAEIRFEYLDGQTVHRQERVESFQSSADIPVFLLSLKAGGVGLNLTAADYVFILDPWWNPAAEAQAIDRTHRIGQNKKVFAYKIIAKDTVEEKILELQNRKKQIAKSVISDENSVLKSLSIQDLRELFVE